MATVVANPVQSLCSVLGVRVDAVQVSDVVARMEEWISRRSPSRVVAVTGMHGVMEAHHDATFKEILNRADLVVPDGMPLVWLGRRKGFAELRRRAYGLELMEEFCRSTAEKGYRHFLYGGALGVADELAAILEKKYPGLSVAGMISPPYRTLTRDGDGVFVEQINSASPEVVWVGLSTPKQERRMHEHRAKLNAPVVLGVGAAFEFHTGLLKRAPAWMREHGLAWLFRLLIEPSRLWRRYLVYGSEFVWLVALEWCGWKKFDLANEQSKGGAV